MGDFLNKYFIFIVAATCLILGFSMDGPGPSGGYDDYEETRYRADRRR